MKKIILILIIFIHGFILTKTIFFPYPELFVYPYLANHGLKPYSQILDQHFPGLMFLPINLDNLGMTNPDIARVWLIGIIIIIHLLLYKISKTLFTKGSLVLLPNLLFLIWQPFFEGWVLWIDTFLPIILLASYYLLLQKKYLYTGLVLGLAVVFKQTALPLAFLIGIFVFWETRKLKDFSSYFLAFITPVLLMVIYFFSLGVLSDFWYWTITFNLTVYAQFGTTVPSTVGFVTRVLLVYVFSLTALFYKIRRVGFITFLFLIGSLAGVFDRADFVHFQPSLPFAVLLTVMGFDSLKKNIFYRVILIIYCLITLWWLFIFYKGHLSSKVLLFDSKVQIIADKIRTYTNPNDKIFIFGAVPHLYQMTNTIPAGNIFVFQLPWFLRVSEERVLAGIIKDKPNIIVSQRHSLIEGVQIKDFAGSIDAYINQNYQEIDRVEDTLILKRK